MPNLTDAFSKNVWGTTSPFLAIAPPPTLSKSFFIDMNHSCVCAHIPLYKIPLQKDFLRNTCISEPDMRFPFLLGLLICTLKVLIRTTQIEFTFTKHGPSLGCPLPHGTYLSK